MKMSQPNFACCIDLLSSITVTPCPHPNPLSRGRGKKEGDRHNYFGRMPDIASVAHLCSCSGVEPERPRPPTTWPSTITVTPPGPAQNSSGYRPCLLTV